MNPSQLLKPEDLEDGSMLREAIAANKLEDKIELAGSICLGACKENGANLRVDGEVVSGITKENFYEFFNTKVIDALK